ncbi:ABC-type hemin transport system ATPase subunit [Nocardiopsis mwathae]|uniref:ABC-type hemin transport system ATPase subunit n=1 Tax=Nocardiopsis mwathae TaxID=1472723 RepID=A0A7X0D3T2_9ACTN|nr:hypothetical protein [Nocardiopsis mwathae]MBB6170345.1 ABC-type hemin transport system ATPase subunit [Nocardiopsis mwathae]
MATSAVAIRPTRAAPVLGGPPDPPSPIAALDIRHQELVLGIARAHAESGGAAVVVPHDLGSAAAYAHRMAVLSRGAIAVCGAPREVFSASLLSDVYRHEVEVLSHPRTGDLLVLPVGNGGRVDIRERPVG